MRRLRKYLIALGIVVLWATVSYAWLGVEDGSSGLSPLGWISAVFFLPGGFAMQTAKGGHSNADLPAMAVLSLCVYAVVAVFAVAGFSRLGRIVSGKRRSLRS